MSQVQEASELVRLVVPRRVRASLTRQTHESRSRSDKVRLIRFYYKSRGRVAPARSDSSDEALSSSSLLLVDSSDSSHLKKNLTCRTSLESEESEESTSRAG